MQSQNKSIWIVVSNRWYSAITAYAISCARALDQKGFEASLTPLLDSPGWKKAVEANLTVVPMQGFSLAYAREFRRIYLKLKPSVIFVFGGPETALLYSISSKTPVIRFRGQDQELGKFKPLSSLAYRRVSKILVPCTHYKTEISKRSRIPVESVAYGISKQSFFYEEMDRGERPTLLIVGRLDPIKGHAQFFNLFKKLIDGFTVNTIKPFLKIIGEESNIQALDLNRCALDAGLSQNDFEIMTKRSSNIREEMNRATVGVMSSLGSEIICRVGAEFLMCGTPIMVTDVGSLTELLFPGAGITYPKRSVNEVVHFISCMFRESGKDRLVRQEKARKLFSLESMGSGLDSVMRPLLGS